MHAVIRGEFTRHTIIVGKMPRKSAGRRRHRRRDEHGCNVRSDAWDIGEIDELKRVRRPRGTI
ncbi:hypothetical protein [Thermopirellula anaerolimosa]